MKSLKKLPESACEKTKYFDQTENMPKYETSRVTNIYVPVLRLSKMRNIEQNSIRTLSG